MYAARIQLVKSVIIPALESGKYVIGDRHDLSTVAYQGAGRGLDMNVINSLRKNILGDFKPDLTLILDLPPEIGLARARKRGEYDRFELEDISFFNRIRNSFLENAQKDPQNIKVIDASLDLEAVTKNIENVLKDFLGV